MKAKEKPPQCHLRRLKWLRSKLGSGGFRFRLVLEPEGNYAPSNRKDKWSLKITHKTIGWFELTQSPIRNINPESIIFDFYSHSYDRGKVYGEPD